MWLLPIPRLAFFSYGLLLLIAGAACCQESGTTVQSLPCGGQIRHYALHLPPQYDGKKRLPLVLMFHGAGGTGVGTMRQTGWDKKADQAGFIVVCPDGTPADPLRPPAFRINPQLWNDGTGRGAIGRLNVDDVGFVRSLLDSLCTHYAIDPKRIYAAGHSNGAGMTFRLGTELATRFAAIAPDASYCWLADPKPARPVPTLYLVGEEDPLVPLAGGLVLMPWGGTENRPPVSETLTRWAKALGCNPTPVLVSNTGGVRIMRYTGPKPGEELLSYTISGLGHAWPGGWTPLPESLIGPKTDKLNATDVVWNFFQKHPLP